MGNKKLWLLVLLTAVVFVGLVSYGDFEDIGQRLADFPVTHLIAALALAGLNFLLRFCRWVYYLRVLKIDVPIGVSCLVFLSGLSMSVTPGKAGELVKSYLLRDRTGVPVAQSAPVVVMERLTDVVAVVLLALVGLALLPLPVKLVLTVTLLLTGFALLLIATRGSDRLLGLPLVRRWRSSLQTSREGLRLLAAPRAIGVAVALGGAAWASEGVALWVILRGLDADVSLATAVPIYAAATLVGAVTALPGGLLGTEGSMVALLQQDGLARGAASAGTLLVRLVTLWFAVLIGLVALACLNRIRPSQVPSAGGGETESPALQTNS